MTSSLNFSGLIDQIALKYLKSPIKWKNERPKCNRAYEPTNVEHVANIISHGAFIPNVMINSYNLYLSSKHVKQEWAFMVYGFALSGLFFVSTMFHIVSFWGKNRFLKDLLHRGDRAMIYIFIAGSYTPWLYLCSFHAEALSKELQWFVWILAAIGITYQQLFHERYKWFETTLYCVIALFPALCIFEMTSAVDLTEMKFGGAAYLLGVIFFKADGLLPFAHAIWHLFVVLGATAHFNGVATHLLHLEEGKEIP